MLIKCQTGCCTLIYEYFKGNIDPKKDYYKYNRMKGGGVLHDYEQDKILIVQSRGKMWGFPKGTKNDNETIEECAIREIKEETGIDVTNDMFEKTIMINNGKSVFYYIKYLEKKVIIQNSIENNDANGIGWVKINCLKQLLEKNKIQLNKQSKLALKNTFEL